MLTFNHNVNLKTLILFSMVKKLKLHIKNNENTFI